MKIEEAVILLGGMGTRLLPYTKTIPKEMLPIYDVPNIFLLVKEAYSAGIKKIIFVVTEHNKNIIKSFFTKDIYLDNFLSDKPDKKELLQEVNEIINNMEFQYVLQDLKGTFGALYSAKDYIKNDNFVVMYGDDLFLDNNLTKELITSFQNDGKMYITGYEEEYNKLPNVGVLIKDNNNYLQNFVPKDTVNKGYLLTGRMLLNKKIFDVKDSLYKHDNDEYYLPYAVLKYKDEVKVITTNQPYFNIGEKIGYIKASIYQVLNTNKDKKELLDFIDKIRKDI